MRSIPVLLSAGALVLTSCGNPSAPVVPVSPELLSAPAEVVVENTTLELSVGLWRNFQPGIGESDTRLAALLRIKAGAGRTVPAGILVERAWLILNDDAWESVPQQEYPQPPSNALDLMLRGGPEWPVGAFVSAVIRLRDSSNNSYLLRATPQAIVAAQ